MAVWYVRDNSTTTTDGVCTSLGSIGWSNITGWVASTVTAAGVIRRQSAVTAAFTASQTTTTITVTAISSGTIVLGMRMTPPSGSALTISAFGTGTGGTGTYTTAVSQSVGSGAWTGGLLSGNERVFIAIVAGTTSSGEPNWTLTKGAKTTDNTVTWQEATGQAAVNGDLTNTPLSSSVRSTNPGLGKIIKDNAGTHIFICSTAGTCGAGEPTYVVAAVGNTTTDSGCTWTYIGTSFSIWSAPHARIENAFAASWVAAGDDVFLGNDHAQTAAVNIFPAAAGTAAAPTNVWCIDHTVSLPATSADLTSDPYTTSSPACAQITTTGATTITGSGIWNCYGVIFNAGTGATNTSVNIGLVRGRFERCSFRKLGTVASSTAVILSAGDSIDCSVQFAATGDSMRTASRSRWIKSSASAILGATLPTLLISPTANTTIIVDGVDLSALGSGKKLVDSTTTTDSYVSFINCKFGSSVTVATTQTARTSTVDAIVSDSSTATYRQERYQYEGTLTNETTIVRTGGASDGTTPLAWKIVTTANSKWVLPFECFPISIWNSTTGSSVTVTVYGIWGGGAVPNNDDIWIDVEYLSSASSPLISLATSTKANYLATGSALTSDSSSWGGSTTKFKMSVSVTPQLAGDIRVYVKAAAASSTFYIDPAPVLT